MKTANKFAIWLLPVSVAAAAFAAPVRNVQELVAALESTTDSSQTIEIAAGDYDLTGVTMRSDASFGDSHLYLQNATLVGKGATADDVRLIGNGLRILWAYSPAKVRNLISRTDAPRPSAGRATPAGAAACLAAAPSRTA